MIEMSNIERQHELALLFERTGRLAVSQICEKFGIRPSMFPIKACPCPASSPTLLLIFFVYIFLQRWIVDQATSSVFK
jgi:hypothetical protein